MTIGRTRTVALLISLLAACDGSTEPAALDIESVEIVPSPAQIPVGETLQLQAVIRDHLDEDVADASGVFWSSEEPSIASVSEQGLVTGHSVGSARVAASVAGVSGIASVTVLPPPVASVSITPADTSIGVGEEVTLRATPRDASGEDLSGRAVTWSSASPAVAEVDGKGRVTGRSTGQAVVRATIEGVVGTATVEVMGDEAREVKIIPEAVAMVVGETVHFELRALDGKGNPVSTDGTKWVSSEPGVVKVSATGVATAVSPGAATVTATLGEASASVGVAVGVAPVATVEVVPDSLLVVVGGEDSLAAVPRASDGTEILGRDVVWRAEDRAIATVDADGHVIGVSPGETTVVASVAGKSGAAKVVVVTAPVASVVVDPSTLSMIQGEAFTLTAEARAADGSPVPGALIRWSSTEGKVATVDASGRVTARAPGKATITAASEGHEGTAEVEVRSEPVASIELSPSSLSLREGETGSLKATLRASDGDVLSGRPVKWSSADPDVATVDGGGKVRARRAGDTEITATSEGRSASASVGVVGKPAQVVIVSGDEQAGLPGETLRNPLVVRVVDSDGRPLEGVEVRWTTNSGSIAPGSNMTGADGTAAAMWTVAGGLARTVSATVEGLPAVTFRAVYFDLWGDDEDDDDEE